jgi:hypothetical protein
MVRNAVNMDLCRSLNLPVQRIGFVHLWINNRFMGFYVVTFALVVLLLLLLLLWLFWFLRSLGSVPDPFFCLHVLLL